MKLFIQKFGITIYMLMLMLHLFAQLLGYTSIQYGSKLVLLPLLMLFFYVQPFFATAAKSKYLILFGLFGSFLGDAFLLSEAYFIPGMIAFMTTHIFNIIFFSKIYGLKQPKSTAFKVSRSLLLFFCWFIYFQLKTAIGPLIYSILVYMALICLAALMAIHVSNNKPTKIIANLFWIPGMLFFIASDTVLAFNKFYWSTQSPIDNIGLVTMATYGIAQLLLVKGFQLYFAKQSAST
jgi:uncharacterized membrane protein YhhN